jgi:hypothetical protein
MPTLTLCPTLRPREWGIELPEDPNPRYHKGMLRIIFYAIIAVLILSFFGISLQSVIHSPAGEANFGYLGDLIVSGWHFIVGFFFDIVDWVKGLF